MKKGVNVVITNKKDEVLVLKRSSNVEFSPNLWDFPGGKEKNNETLQEVGKREAKEESGLEVELEEKPFFVYYYSNRDLNVYALKAKSFTGKILLNNKEHADFKWISKNNWKKLNYTPSVEATLKELFR